MDKKHVVAVTGGRNYTNLIVAHGVLDYMHAHAGPIGLLVHGGATGADSLADGWAKRRGVSTSVFKANWNLLGRSAGPIRNRRMLEDSKPDYLLVFHGGRGTDNCCECARAMGIEIVMAEKVWQKIIRSMA